MAQTQLRKPAPAFRAPTNGAGPAWLQERRKKAFGQFQTKGFPTPHEEDWRYTDVQSLAEIPFALPDEGRLGAKDVAALPLPELGAPRLVLVNGRISEALSDLSALPKGVRVQPLSKALSTDAGRSLLPPVESPNPFTELNDALWQEGVLIDVGKGARLPSLHLLNLHDAREPAAVHPRTVVRLAELAEATLVESFAGRSAKPVLVNAVTSSRLQAGSRLHHATLQQQPDGAWHIHTVEAVLGRDANYRHHNLALGADLSRADVNVRFEAPGGEAALNGLYLLQGTQHHDTHSRIDHAVPHCTSTEFYKGILDGRSRGVFYGKILVRKDAQKTLSNQTNKNLLLSTGALVDSTPALEINANDVKCNHGSTTGQLDAQSVFYLRSRGLDEATARSLLTYAFARDLIGQVPVPELRSHLEAQLAQRLPAGTIVQEVLHANP